MDQVVHSAPRLAGTIRPPGDKSITHRAAIFNAIAHGSATVRGASTGADCAATLRCLRAMGVPIKGMGPHTTQGAYADFTITGATLQEPANVLDAGNSGTTTRLLAGLLAGQPFLSVLTGDSSLRSRPMGRIIQPLRLMGADIYGRKGDSLAPLVIRGRPLSGIEYTLPVASAQVKSALLLAALFARGETILHQPAPSRDHTEQMLAAMGVPIHVHNLTVSITARPLKAMDVTVPGDISSAAFWLVAALVHPNAQIRISNVGVNPTRTGILDVLQEMGANIRRVNQRVESGEPVADLVAHSSQLKAANVGGDLIPRLIDEIPILALAACFARGTTVIRDAAELRVKESDRIRTVAEEMTRLGARIRELPDGMEITGVRRLSGAAVRSYGDHRLAMALGIAGLVAQGETAVQGAECASVSYPTFWRDLEAVSRGQ